MGSGVVVVCSHVGYFSMLYVLCFDNMMCGEKVV